jgi:lysophospholipase L1-like esterase
MNQMFSAMLAAADAKKKYDPLPVRDYVAGDNGTRRVVMPLGDSMISAAVLARDFNQRTLLRLPRRVKRFRIRAANHNLFTATVLTSPVTLSNFYMGEPVYDTTVMRRWNGSFVSAPTLVLPGTFSVPTDGTDWVSNWATIPNALQEKDILLSYGVVTAATGTGVGISGTGDLIRGGVGSSGNAGDLVPVGFSYGAGQLFGDIRVEYEVEAGTRVGVFFGDSITAGAADTAGAIPPEGDARVGILPSERWPDLAGRAANFCAINLGVGSITAAGFNTTSVMAITRAAIGTSATIPDFGVILLGTNDLPVGFTSTTQRIADSVGVMKALGVKDVYLATILPKGLAASSGTLSSATIVGATSITSTIDIVAGATTVVGMGADYEVVTVTAHSGAGPYTLTVNAMTKAHAAGSRIVSGDEAVRIRVNAWIRQQPLGIAGVLDFDQLMADTVGGPMPLRSLMFADLVHPHRAGAARMGLFAAQLGRV